MINRQIIYKCIEGERVYQDKRWGPIIEHPHEVGAWLLIMRKLLCEAEGAWIGRRGDHGAMDELRQLLAAGVACAEQHGMPPR